MLRFLLISLLVLFVAYLVVVVLVYARQDRLLYFPTRELTSSPAHYDLDFYTVAIHTNDGEQLHGWWIPARQERAALLFFHGNAGNISGRLEAARLFNRLGLSVLLFDYRGYGQSTGTPSEAGLYSDAEAAWQELNRRSQGDRPRLIYGRSLGTGPATWLASQTSPAALILESPFTSIPDVAAQHYSFLPVHLLATNRFDNRARIEQINVPLLILHSPTDEVIPFSHGQTLYDAARQPKSLVRLDGGHNDGHLATGARYSDSLGQFLDRHLVE